MMVTNTQGMIGFAKPENVVADSERQGLLRAQMASKAYTEAAQVVDAHYCDLHDCATTPCNIDFSTMGFDILDLSQNSRLQKILQAVQAQGELKGSDAQNIRRALHGKKMTLSNGKRLRIIFVANEGIIVRSSGPNGLDIKHTDTRAKNSRQPAASLVHADQDVSGYPVKSIMKGLGPKLLHHTAPDSENRRSPLNLVNLWIPLQQITMPLCMMDKSSVDRKHHQLRMEINTDEVLDRNAKSKRNDIWTYLYDKNQQWYFNSHMSIDKAYVFDTLGTPHSAAVLTGEQELETYYLRLKQCCRAIEENDLQMLGEVCSLEMLQLPENMTVPVATAIKRMEALLQEGARQPEAVINKPARWIEQAGQAMNAVVRKSIELRALALVY